MKRLLTAVFILPFLLGCKDKGYTGRKITLEKDESGKLTEVDPSVMYDVVVTNEKDAVFYIGDETCSACQKLKPQLESWVKVNKGKIYYIPVGSITNENMHYLIDSTVGYYEWKENDAVPITYFFMEGAVVMQTTYDNTMNFLMKYVTVEE